MVVTPAARPETTPEEVTDAIVAFADSQVPPEVESVKEAELAVQMLPTPLTVLTLTMETVAVL